MTRLTEQDRSSMLHRVSDEAGGTCPARPRTAAAMCGRDARSEPALAERPATGRDLRPAPRPSGWWAFCSQAGTVGARL